METEADLPRRLTLLDATSLVIGSVIGGGIFLVPSVIARHLPSPTAILLVWLFAGVLSFFGALAFAELGAMMPATGGQYVFLREAYGSLWAFLCGWTLFMVIMSAQISSLAIGFSIYLAQFIPLSPFWLKAAALAMIAVITAINYRGAKSGALVQKILMFLKLAGLAILIVSAFASPAHSVTQPAGFANISATQVGFAMIACLLAYDGWNVVSFIAGEVHRPQRNIPLALGLGVASIAVVYLLANAAFLRILPVAEMATTERVGAVVASRTIGPIGATLVTLTILISIVGSLNGAVMTPPRIYFAQARDGLFFRRFGVVDAGSQTPGFGLIVQGIWAALLALTGTYETLISFAIFSAWVFYALTVTGLIVLRWKRPKQPRPYRMWGYPFTTIAFVAIAVWFVITTWVQSPVTSTWGAVFIASGVPIYYLWRWKARVR